MKNPKFKPRRITRSYRQTINAPAPNVFPLLCPVREAEWLDGWQYRMIYSESGLVEEGAVFTTAQDGEADTVWVVTRHELDDLEVHFTRFTPESRTCLLKIKVNEKDEKSFYVDITYIYTALAPAGNTFIENFTRAVFLEAVTFWEKSMNYFLETGQKLKKE